jgi:putative restriction endonuclease
MTLERQVSGFPRIDELRRTSGHLPDGFASALLADRKLLNSVVQNLLNLHFEETLHADILAAVGLPEVEVAGVAESFASYGQHRRRDPQFREKVLRAYEHRCAVTGFRAALRGAYFGCEAAHVKWFACEGPDVVENGIAMEPTLHKLFDAGAWSLTDDRRILVSSEFTGSDEAVARLRELHGKPLRKPLPGSPQVLAEYIHWHREPKHGGVFRQPALPL